MALSTLLTKGLLTNFFEGYNAAETNWDKVATKVPSTARSETYGWLGSVPRLREMKGERVPRNSWSTATQSLTKSSKHLSR